MNIFLKLHLITIIPVLLAGPWILLRKKGDRLHMFAGRIWALLMIVSCLLTFGITTNGKYSWLHVLSGFTLYQIIRAIYAIKKRNLKVHQRAMTGSFLGALIAFVFAALIPGRLIHTWFSGLIP